MNKFLLVLIVLGLAACDVDVVPVDDTPAPSTYVSGQVKILIDNGLPLGPTILVRYDCDDPPPPVGTGSPADFLIVPERAFSGGTADFTFPQVPAASCHILAGFVDRDRDFHYNFGVSGQITAGDIILEQQVVATGELDGDWIEPVTGVELVGEREMPLERPVFSYRQVGAEEDGATLLRGPVPGSTPNVYLDFVTEDLDSDLIDVEDAAFSLVFGPDADGDGWPDDNNADGAPDVLWPRVLIFKLDADDPSGLTRADPTVLLPGVVLPLDTDAPMDITSNRLLQAMAAGIPFDGQSIFPVTEMRVAVPPLVVTDLATRSTADIEVFHTEIDFDGEYQVLVMNSTGQVWNLPNELAGFGHDDQDLRLVVQAPEEAPELTRIAGTVTVSDEDGQPAGDVQVVRFDCADPPPPAGSGSPLDLSVIKKESFADGVGAFAFDTVAHDSCSIITGAVDVDGDFSAFFGVAQGFTAGDVSLETAIVQVGTEQPELVELAEAAVVPLEMPAFDFWDVKTGQSGATVAMGPAVGTTPNTVVHFETRGVESIFGSVEDPLFTLVFEADGDGDGWPDDLNGDGAPDVKWPRILAVRLDPEDPQQLTRAEGPVVLPGVVLPFDIDDAFNFETNLVLQAMAAGLPFDGEQVIPMTDLNVIVPPLVVTDLATRATAPIEAVAASGVEVTGEYQVVVMNSTGQVWTMPNEISALGEPLQGATLTVEAVDAPVPGLTTVTGTVTVDEVLGEPSGDGIVLRFDCADPPPPAGSGSPIDLSIIKSWDGQVGSYSFEEVPEGSCVLLTGFLDRDGDFSPFYEVNKGATAGDVAIDAVVAQVGSARENGLVDPVVAELEANTPIPLERPAFAFADVTGADVPTMTVAEAPGTTETVMLSLSGQTLETVFTDVVSPLFGVTFAPDLDGDPFGLPDDFNGDGLPDAIWPRILLRKLDPADPLGLAVADPPVILPGVLLTVDPADPFNPATSLLAQALEAGIDVNSDHLFPVPQMTVVVPGLVIESLDPLELAPIELAGESVEGDYQILVMNPTGQLWTVPNELGHFDEATQAGVFRVEVP